MKLIVDQGNSVCKVALYKGSSELCATAVKTAVEPILVELFERYNIEASIYSSVGGEDEATLRCLERLSPRHYRLSAETPVPIEVRYQRATLGGDRLASACGAYRLLGKEAVALVIDAGTALTYEYLSRGGVYEGGNISLGLHMRFKALSHFTQRLPLIEDTPETMPLAYGVDTRSAITQGVVRGMVEEVRAYIASARADLGEDLVVLLTGGDAAWLHRHLAMPSLLWVPNLVSLGLLEILEYNSSI